MSLEDKIDILDVIARYSDTYDRRDADGFAQLFTEDGIFEVLYSGGNDPELRLESRAAIYAWAAQRHQGKVATGIQDRHYQSGTLFESLTPEQAHTRTMILITHQGPHDLAPRPVLAGVYHDRWQKTRIGWQFLQRTLQHDHQKPYLTQ